MWHLIGSSQHTSTPQPGAQGWLGESREEWVPSWPRSPGMLRAYAAGGHQARLHYHLA